MQIIKNQNQKIIAFEMSENLFYEKCDALAGLCVNCGYESQDLSADELASDCEACKHKSMYSVLHLMYRGAIRLVK